MKLKYIALIILGFVLTQAYAKRTGKEKPKTTNCSAYRHRS